MQKVNKQNRIKQNKTDKEIKNMSKFVEANEKIAEAVVEGYKKIEDGVVGGYKKIEEGVVEGFEKIDNGRIEAMGEKAKDTIDDMIKVENSPLLSSATTP